jgi:acyl carrier protein
VIDVAHPDFAAQLVEFIRLEVASDVPVGRDTDLVLSGAVDSLGVMRIVEWIERRLDTHIDPGDVVIEHFGSVDAIVTFLAPRLGAGDVDTVQP